MSVSYRSQDVVAKQFNLTCDCHSLVLWVQVQAIPFLRQKTLLHFVTIQLGV